MKRCTDISTNYARNVQMSYMSDIGINIAFHVTICLPPAIFFGKIGRNTQVS